MADERRDRYGLAVEYFLAHPDELQQAWMHPGDHSHGCLFLYATQDGLLARKSDPHHRYGDPIQIRSGNPVYVAEEPSLPAGATPLTELLRNDELLPGAFSELLGPGLQGYLERLAYWQRVFDRYWKNRSRRFFTQEELGLREAPSEEELAFFGGGAAADATPGAAEGCGSGPCHP
jgi:hypothetical protein